MAFNPMTRWTTPANPAGAVHPTSDYDIFKLLEDARSRSRADDPLYLSKCWPGGTIPPKVLAHEDESPKDVPCKSAETIQSRESHEGKNVGPIVEGTAQFMELLQEMDKRGVSRGRCLVLGYGSVGPTGEDGNRSSRFATCAITFFIEVGSKFDPEEWVHQKLRSIVPTMNVIVRDRNSIDSWFELEVRSGTPLFDAMVETGRYVISEQYRKTAPSEKPPSSLTSPTAAQSIAQQPITHPHEILESDEDWIILPPSNG